MTQLVHKSVANPLEEGSSPRRKREATGSLLAAVVLVVAVFSSAALGKSISPQFVLGHGRSIYTVLDLACQLPRGCPGVVAPDMVAAELLRQRELFPLPSFAADIVAAGAGNSRVRSRHISA